MQVLSREQRWRGNITKIALFDAEPSKWRKIIKTIALIVL
jgi:hypothetical protein